VLKLLLDAGSCKKVMAAYLKVMLDTFFTFKICTAGIKNNENMYQ
jgi:hypothetical protein